MAWLQAIGIEIARILGINTNQLFSDPSQPSDYDKDSEIPFTPDGNSPLIGGAVERVKGLGNQFQGRKIARKTIIITAQRHQVADKTWQKTTKRRLTREARVICEAQHRHVVHLLCQYFDNQSGKMDEVRFAIIMNRADGNLRSYLRPGHYPNKRWFGCLLGVVCYIHNLDILHGAIKPENILVEKGQVLLTDFGLSQRGVGTMVKCRKEWNSVYEYWAPEVEDNYTISKKGDIFSLGAVFLEMLIILDYSDKFESFKSILKGQCPSDGILSYANNIHQVHSWIEELDTPGWQDNKIRSKCKEMIRSDHIQRPSTEDLSGFLSSLSAEFKGCTCVSVGA